MPNANINYTKIYTAQQVYDVYNKLEDSSQEQNQQKPKQETSLLCPQ